jgi:hypothetical protein
LFEKSFLSKSGYEIDEVKYYNNLVNQVSAETISPDLFMTDGVKKREKFSISDDFQSRSHFLIEGNNVLNPFEISHEIKRIKQSYYNFDLWKKDVVFKMPEITFLDPVFIDVVGDEEADKLDKERRQIKKDFLDRLKGIYHTPEILNLVFIQTKNDNLKGKIKRHLEGLNIEETLTPEERVLFRDKCYNQVSKWVANTFKLKVLIKSNLREATKVIIEENLFSSTTFNRTYKRDICILLDKEDNPDKTKNEHQLFNRYTKILNLFKDVESISKNDLEVIFRTKLNYRNREFNTSVVVNEIGFVFDVLYDKKTQLYSVKKWDKLLSYSIQTPPKVCTKQNIDNKGVKDEKTLFFPNGDQSGKSAKIEVKASDEKEQFTPEEIEKFEEKMKQNNDEDLMKLLETLDI